MNIINWLFMSKLVWNKWHRWLTWRPAWREENKQQLWGVIHFEPCDLNRRLQLFQSYQQPQNTYMRQLIDQRIVLPLCTDKGECKELYWSDQNVLSQRARWPMKEKTGFPIYNQDKSKINACHHILSYHIILSNGVKNQGLFSGCHFWATKMKIYEEELTEERECVCVCGVGGSKGAEGR